MSDVMMSVDFVFVVEKAIQLLDIFKDLHFKLDLYIYFFYYIYIYNFFIHYFLTVL